MRFTFLIPPVLDGKVQIEGPYENFTKTGLFSSFGVDITLHALSLHKSVKASDPAVLVSKVNNQLTSWAKKFETHQRQVEREATQQSVEAKNSELSEQYSAIDNILLATLDIDDAVDWNSLKSTEAFPRTISDYFDASALPDYIITDRDGKPENVSEEHVEPLPDLSIFINQQGYGRLKRWFGKKGIAADYEKAQSEHFIKAKAASSTMQRRNKSLTQWQDKYNEALLAIAEDKAEYESRQSTANAAVDELKNKYQNGSKPAVEEYCDIVLNASMYPAPLEPDFIIEYHNDEKRLLVEYQLPSPGDLPSIAEYRFIRSRNAVEPKFLPKAKQKALYDDTCYKIALRTVHELFEADVASHIDTVVFNGVVTSTSPATGRTESKIILSLSADKDEFLAIDLANISPKATFKHLKGVAATSLVDIAPVPPIASLTTTDRRFVGDKDISSNIDNSTNLAPMDWEEFEHLVREIFEKEFESGGGTVKVTQASADGGVDAIAFDPDPIRGGKIVIQAKRYTNTVRVSAIRDLYGTVMNEGASKGLLVTTSSFGSDSYAFAKDKPLGLINGANLLALLEKHGRKARINIQEAKGKSNI